MDILRFSKGLTHELGQKIINENNENNVWWLYSTNTISDFGQKN